MHISLHDVEGQRLRVGVRRGDAARRPLLLFNGIGANIELVEPFFDALDSQPAIVFDVPGVGGSPPPWLPYRPSTLARLAARLLDQLGHRQVDVLGVSWGGALAQQFAFQKSQRCRRLVLAATSPGHLMVPGRLTVLLKMATPPQLVAGIGWSSLPWLRLLPQPTLIMAGTDDPIVPVINARILARLIPDARLVTIDDGHLFLLTSADDSAKIISAFLGNAAH